MSNLCHIDDTVMWDDLLMKPFLLALHVASALIQILFFAFLNKKIRQKLIRSWANRLLIILQVKVVVSGGVPEILRSNNYLIVSNHISWLDIHVINSIRAQVFVAKSDVADWPIFGWIAKMIGTIFIQREKLSDLKRVIQLIKSRLNDGDSVCIFPEGTSSDGKSVLEFRSNLFEAVANSDHLILPIAIQYREHQQYSDRAAFIGDMGLLDSIKKILKSRVLEAHIVINEPLSTNGTRQGMALQARQSILGTSLFQDS
jgi:1-acyl-sn-glycerol-3-phosphate acyltransferase